MSYEDFMKGLVTAKAIAIKLPTDDDKWVRFSLNGCSKAIGMLGKEIE